MPHNLAGNEETGQMQRLYTAMGSHSHGEQDHRTILKRHVLVDLHKGHLLFPNHIKNWHLCFLLGTNDKRNQLSFYYLAYKLINNLFHSKRDNAAYTF